MKKVEFSETELGKRAFLVYSDSSFTFYRNRQGVYFVAYNAGETPAEIGTLQDCIEFLEQFTEED